MRPYDVMTGPLTGTHILEASAGTGKTYTIADIYLRLVTEQKIPVEKILVVTFTVAATEELRGRLRTRIREGLEFLSGGEMQEELPVLGRYRGNNDTVRLLTQALNDFDRASIYTIHGFCQRMLLEQAFESGSLFDTGLAADQLKLLEEAVDDFWRLNFYDGPPHLLTYVLGRITHASLQALARVLDVNPVIRVIPDPEAVSAGELEMLLSGIAARYEELRALWTDGSDRIKNDFHRMVADKALDGRSYKAMHTGSRLEKLSAFINDGNPYGCVPQLEYFTSSKLGDCAKDPARIVGCRFFDAMDEYWNGSTAAEGLFGRYLVELKAGLFRYIGREMEKRKTDKNIRTFNDLLAEVHGAVHGPGGADFIESVRRKFHAALIDEFQDTDAFQYDIFMSIFGGGGSLLYLVGDPKQSIYRFRGADIFAYMRAASGIESRATLGKNWRSVPGLVRAINAVFSPLRDPFVFDRSLIGFPDVEPSEKEQEMLESSELDPAPLQLWFLGSSCFTEGRNCVLSPQANDIIAGSVAREAARLISLGMNNRATIGGRGLRPGDLAVLVRSRHQGDLVRRAFGARRIPCVVYGTESVYRSGEAVEMARILGAVSDPGNGGRVRVALATDALGYTANEIYSLSLEGKELEKVHARFARYRDLWVRDGFMRMFRQLLMEEHVYGNLIPLPDGERRVTNMLHLAELLHGQESSARPGIEGLIKWFAETVESAGDTDETQIRLETDEDAVKIMTLHGSKGLQFPVVFSTFLWKGTGRAGDDFVFYDGDPAKGGSLAIDIGSDSIKEHMVLAEKEELAESVRLLYVGLTRAKCRCYTAWGLINESRTSAEAWVFHQPPEIDANDVVDSLGTYVSGLDEKAMLADLDALVKRSGGTVCVTAPPMDDAAVRIAGKGKASSLGSRSFSGKIKSDWTVTSYTSMVSGGARDDAAKDRDRTVIAAPADEAGLAEDIFDFPAGALAGTCLHSIFERLDFAGGDAAAEQIVTESLSRYGFQKKWTGPVAAMVHNVMNAALEKSSGLKLGLLRAEDRVAELEFYHPLSHVTPEGLARLFGNSAVDGIRERIGSLTFSPRRGFMHGFIDLVFQWKDRYYIIDWKSNFLGKEGAGYSAGAVAAAMAEHHYLLQYHIYAVALHRYLSTRLPGYEYEKNFGGVFYLFLRGVDPAAPGQGVFHDRPGKKLIEEMSRYFGEGEAR